MFGTNWKGLLGFLFVAVGFVLTIVSMATYAWLQIEDCGYGLVQYRCCSDSSCSTHAISSLSGAGDIEYGGKVVIAVGIISLLVAIAGFVSLYLAQKKQDVRFRLATLVAFLVAGALTILAVILYSKQTVDLDYAFILYLFSSFTALIGCTIILAGPGANGAAGATSSTSFSSSLLGDSSSSSTYDV